jgi:integrase
MNQRFRLFQRAKVFYCQDTTTRKQTSLHTKDAGEAQTLLHAKNEAYRQPALNLQLARTYLAASDPEIGTRTWQGVMDEMARSKDGSTLDRHERASKNESFDLIRSLPILETNSTHFLKVLHVGSVSTNVYLRRIHNFALDMGWLPWPVLPKKRWPAVRYKEKRAITAEEHQKIIEIEWLPERRAYYEILWHVGGSQSDVAALRAEDIDWQRQTLSYTRLKTKEVAILHMGETLAKILRSLPQTGPLFPRISQMHEKHRAAEFKRRCKRLKIEGISLHCYRYAWAERAKTAGYLKRFAMKALAHNSVAIHRACAKHAPMNQPPFGRV